jgi:hypothetical protein
LLASGATVRDNFWMSVSSLWIAKSETRQLAERDRDDVNAVRVGEAPAWAQSNSVFFTVFVAIAAVLAAIALVAR